MFAKSIVTKGGDVFRDEFSVAFDGTNDYLTMGDITLVDGLDDLTITCWIKPKTANRNPILTKGNYNDSAATFNFTYNLDSSVDSGAGRIQFSAGNSVYAFRSSLGAEADKWHHMAVTYSNTDDEIFFYLNGNKITPTATSGSGGSATFISLANTSKELKIGGDDSHYAEGNISEVTLYNTILTANQVKTIYNGREPYNHKEGVASNYLQAWYRMGDGALDERNSDTVFTNSGIIADEASSTLGNNLVTNGTFDADSDWTKGTGWSIGSGVATATSVANQELTQDVGVVVGKIYKISFDMTSFTGGFLSFNVGGGAESYALVNTGHVYAYQKATNTNDLRFDDGGPGALTCSIDNVKVQEVTGNPALFVNMGQTDIEGDTP